MVDFTNLSMHIMCLGVEKKLIPQTSIMFNKKKKIENQAWKRFLDTIHANQKLANKVNRDWFMTMSFSLKEENKPKTIN